MSQQFQKRVEDFVCENCGVKVVGNGYTNHCPRCLFSKHVDINPGDRVARCGGMMEPMRVESRSGEFIIIHRCQKCGYEKPNRADKDDDLDAYFDHLRARK